MTRGEGEGEDARAATLSTLTTQIRQVLTQKNYPCVAALRSFFREDYVLGTYEGFGTGRDWRSLRNDLLWFLEEQDRTQSAYLTMWAIFPEAESTDETTFEGALWSELAHLTSVEQREADWGGDLGRASDPSSQEFCFHLGGHELFVVGLHPQSSRASRRFPWSALVFNAFDQFVRLEQRGAYAPMVEMNRRRDEAFQGQANPMSVAHGDRWEAIQFSGKENSPSWRCPFRFVTDSEKSG